VGVRVTGVREQGGQWPPATSHLPSPQPYSSSLACFRCWYSFGILFVFNSAFTDYRVSAAGLGGGRVSPPPSRAAAGCIAPHSQDMVTVIPTIDCFEAKFCKTELS